MFSEQRQKLKILGYIEILDKSMRYEVDNISYFVNKKFDIKDWNMLSTFGKEVNSYFIYNHFTKRWTKYRFEIPPLTPAEKILYGT